MLTFAAGLLAFYVVATGAFFLMVLTAPRDPDDMRTPR
jgi:hypothetical protein